MVFPSIKVSGSCTLETITAHAIVSQIESIVGCGKYLKPAQLKPLSLNLFPARQFKIMDNTSFFTVKIIH